MKTKPFGQNGQKTTLKIKDQEYWDNEWEQIAAFITIKGNNYGKEIKEDKTNVN